MTFDDIVSGTALFVDANPLIYHFSPHPRHGAACTRLVERIEHQDIQGFTSIHVLGDVAHRLMTIEAMHRLSWPQAGIAARLRKHCSEIPHLTVYLQAVAKIPQIGIQVLPVAEPLIHAAVRLTQQHQLLFGDALVAALMQQHGLTHLASHDADFDRVPGITRYAPS